MDIVLNELAVLPVSLATAGVVLQHMKRTFLIGNLEGEKLLRSIHGQIHTELQIEKLKHIKIDVSMREIIARTLAAPGPRGQLTLVTT